MKRKKLEIICFWSWSWVTKTKESEITDEDESLCSSYLNSFRLQLSPLYISFSITKFYVPDYEQYLSSWIHLANYIHFCKVFRTSYLTTCRRPVPDNSTFSFNKEITHLIHPYTPPPQSKWPKLGIGHSQNNYSFSMISSQTVVFSVHQSYADVWKYPFLSMKKKKKSII